jgi:hypothetical protein
VYKSVDVASRDRIRVAFNSCFGYIHRVCSRDHFSHLESSVTGMSLETSAGAQLLTFVYKNLHVCPHSVKAITSLCLFILAVRAVFSVCDGL